MSTTSPTQDLPKPPEPLPQPIRLLTALASLSSSLHPPNPPAPTAQKWFSAHSASWLRAVCKLLEIDTGRLPPDISPDAVRSSAADQIGEWSEAERLRVAGVLVEASLASSKDESNKAAEEGAALRYTATSRALAHTALDLLFNGAGDEGAGGGGAGVGQEAGRLLSEAERNLSLTLFKALKAAQEDEQKQKVESTRAAHSQGWGGTLGRHLATGAGVIAGGVLIGVTGGLAAPAIATLLAPLGIGGLISAGAAPVVFGTLFGVGGGGLAGRRVRERWKGVEEFGFVEVGEGHKATKEEREDLSEARKRVGEKKAAEDEQERKEQGERGEAEEGAAAAAAGEENGEKQAEKEVEKDRAELEESLLKLSLDAGTRASVSSAAPGEGRASTDSQRLGSPVVSLDQGKEEKSLEETKKPPSLIATIVVPGLLTVSRTEAITAWRAICSARAPSADVMLPGYTPREKVAESAIVDDKKEGQGKELAPAPPPTTTTTTISNKVDGLKDGRDVYLLRFETAAMLKTGRDIDHWVGTKLKGKLKGEIIKRTVLNAYFAAVALPRSVYSMATMSLDNTWIQAQDRAKKAGRILGEVLEKKVQGERPVVLIGSSLGALTVLHALLYLASLPPPHGATSAIPTVVESAYLISLPAAPSEQEWAKARAVTARRLVNAYSDSDYVLAGVVRLHEVLSRAVTLESGIQVAGLGPVQAKGVENVDISKVLRGHMELQTKMGEIIRVIGVDK